MEVQECEKWRLKINQLVLKQVKHVQSDTMLRSGYPPLPDRGPRYSESPCLQSLPEGHGLPFPHHAMGDTDACIHPHPLANYLSFC